jgi:uncharacterized protein YsxB (DUF464 family)
MLTITFYRDDRGRLSGFSARGHADFADDGQDIVCAAASAILQAARLGLEIHCTPKPETSQISGQLKLKIPVSQRDDEAVRAIVTTALASADQIARQFPEHVVVKEAAEARKRRGSAPGRVTSLADRRRGQDV